MTGERIAADATEAMQQQQQQQHDDGVEYATPELVGVNWVGTRTSDLVVVAIAAW